MNAETKSPQEPAAISRRDALRQTLAAGLGLAAVVTSLPAESCRAAEMAEVFVPENDYPFFGYRPQ